MDVAGVWHFRTRHAGRQSTVPDRIDMGPCNLWMTLSGHDLSDVRTSDPARRRRVCATIWAGSVPQQEWRRLRVAAHWHMQRAPIPVQGTL